MNNVKYYLKTLQETKGSDVQKIKAFLETHLDSWYLEDQSLVIDLLDDKNLVAEDLLEALRGIAEFDTDNRAFHNAVTAIDLLLKEEHRRHLAKAPVKVEEELSLEDEMQSNDPVLGLDHYEEGISIAG